MKNVLSVLMILVTAVSLRAQQQQQDADPMARYLFPPDLIMAHQEELGLQENQRAAIKAEVLKAQPKFLEWQWEMGEETQKMMSLLRTAPVDEAKVLEQADRIMGLERNVKRTHLSLLVRLRNLLTPEQRAKLEQLRGR